MNHLLKAISEANNHLLKEYSITHALQECITALGSNTLVDRCYIFKNEIKDGVLILNYEYEWCKKDVTPFIGNPELSGIPYDVFPGLLETLIQNLPLYGLVRESENVLFRETMEMQGIKSYLFTPIFSNDEFWGWIGFDDCETERIWQEEEVNVIHTVARNIGIRLNQDKVHFELESALDELNFYMKSSKQAKWEWNIITGGVKFTYYWFEMLGFTPEELEESFETWRNRIHPDDLSEIEQNLSNYINKISDNYSGVVRMLHKLGHYVWIKYSGIMITDNFGVATKIVGTHIDISEIKEKEIELAQQRNEYDHLVNSLAEVIFKTELNGDIIFLNSQWEKTTGYKINRCIHQNLFDYFENITSEIIEKQLEESSSTKLFEAQLVKKNGHKIWVLLILTIQTDIRNNKKIAIGSITDINDTISLKNELEISEQKFRFIAENTSDLIMQHRPDGIVTYVSSNCEKLIGYKPHELLNKSPYLILHPDDLERIKIQHKNILNFKNEIMTFRVRRKDQEYIWCETSSNIILNSNKEIIGVQTSSRDITERVKDQEEIKLALEKERELNELKSGFVTMASHQFRTPLSVIFSNVELLNYKINTKKVIIKDDVEVITNRIGNEVNRMTELMNNILVFGEYESNNLKIEIKEILLSDFIEKLIETYFNNEKDNRKLIFEMTGTEKPILSDESLLIHILNNLISNAFKYSKGSSNPILKIDFEPAYFKIQIIDFGIGIIPKETKHLFKSFYRGSNTSTIQGSGLGLIIAKQFTELLNGTISISSKIDEMTVVSLKFPYKQKKNRLTNIKK